MSEGNKRQVSHTYSVTGTQPIKQLAVIRAQQLGLTGALAAAHRADTDTDRNQSHGCEIHRAAGTVSVVLVHQLINGVTYYMDVTN